MLAALHTICLDISCQQFLFSIFFSSFRRHVGRTSAHFIVVALFSLSFQASINVTIVKCDCLFPFKSLFAVGPFFLFGFVQVMSTACSFSHPSKPLKTHPYPRLIPFSTIAILRRTKEKEEKMEERSGGKIAAKETARRKQTESSQLRFRVFDTKTKFAQSYGNAFQCKLKPKTYKNVEKMGKTVSYVILYGRHFTASGRGATDR